MTESHSTPNAHLTNHPLTTPGHLIASLPGALGYFPYEAAAVIALRSNPDRPDDIEVGPYLCADLGNPTAIDDMLAQIPVRYLVGCVAVIVSRVPESAMVAEAIGQLHAAADDFGPLIDACWTASEIADGTHYELIFGPLPDHVHPLDWGCDYLSGTVASVMTAQSMMPLIANGLLPELERDDTFRHFDPVSDGDVTMCEHLAANARVRGSELLEMVRVAPALVRPELERACEILRSGPAANFIDSDGGLVAADVFQNEEEITLVAALLSASRLRDCLIVAALGHPREAAAVLLTVARNFTGEVRANALSLWAMIAISQNLHPWAHAALHCSAEEVPGHELTRLVEKCLVLGIVEELFTACVSGCSDTWFELGD